MKARNRTLIALVLVGGALIYLIAAAVSNTTMYYFTVEEALAKGLDSGSRMRINGEIRDGSIDWRPQEMRLAFAIEGESGGIIRAEYEGPKPDNFAAGIPAILEGKFGPDGVFVVDKLMLACPSRFEAEGEAPHAGTQGGQAAGVETPAY